jgi:ribonuclease R
MDITAEKIVAYVSKENYRPVRPRELAKEMKIPEKQYRKFRRMVKDLISDGELVKIRGGRIGPPGKMSLKVGKIQITQKGFAFLMPDDGADEIYIRANDTKTALNGDKVVVRVKPYKTPGKKAEGEVVKVLERARTTIVGTYHSSKYFEYIEPDDPSFKRDVYIMPDHGLSPKDGQKVAVMLKEWKNQFLNPEGKLIEVLGFPHEAGVDVLSVIKKYELPLEFQAPVLREASKVKYGITQAEIKKRRDFRDQTTFTIDPADAKDFDDALSLRKNGKGNYLVGVHIADVSHYVREGGALDKEARNRATSVYLVDRVLPMLPEHISNEICSLKGGEERLTYTCEMEITPKGNVTNFEIFKSIIKSSARLSYDEVQDYFDSAETNGVPIEVAEALGPLRALAKKLRKRRFQQGSLDFDLPEPLVIMDQSGEVVDVRVRPRKESHKLIEEFMLLANKCVAIHFVRLGLPTLFRVHDQPDRDKIHAFQEFAKSFGYNFNFPDPIKPKHLAGCIRQFEDTPEEELLNEILLRSLKKAQYQRENIGHFGLAFENYLHFTSPIRRYPDLMVHRLLAEIKNKKYPGERMSSVVQLLDRVGRHSTDMEIIAEKAERETIKIKQVLYLSKQVGNIYEGIISGITSGGFFVRLLQFSAEGMVRLSLMEDDYYYVDMERYEIRGRHKKKSYRLGDKIFVQIVDVDLVFYRIDLKLVENDKPAKGTKVKKARKRRKKKKNG